MHISDLNDALAGNDISAVEDAFRALVGWPGEDRIVGSTASQRKAALEAVCKALEGDKRIMPRATMEAIEAVFEGAEDGTYASGAKAVQERMDHFAMQLDRESR